jgi:hypothetical protein
MKKIISILLITGYLLLVSGAAPALADFNPNFIISDSELIEYDSMNMEQIQEFLENKNSYLADYVDPTVRITSAQAIYDSAHLHQINPKYILVLLQKEQSLIQDGNPTQDQLDWATGYGICDGCKKTDAAVQKYKGFVNQVDWGAGGTRYYFDHPGEFTYQVGQTYNISDTNGSAMQVTIVNNATRSLYIYTPHIHGNQNFYNIWQNWFSTSYFDGSLLQDAESGGIYLIRDGKKHPFLSKSAFLSRYPSFDRIVVVNPADLDNYPTGQAIEYPNYSLLQIPTGGIYLLDDDTLRPIASKEAFRLLGFNPEEVTPVESKDIFFYKIGEAITEKSAYPTGALLQDKDTGGVYYVQNGVKQPILAREMIKLYYADKKITPVTPGELGNYTTAEPVKLRDGELVRSPEDPAVYFVSNGQKLPFASAEAFNGLGYKWENIVTLPQKVLNLHPTGEMIMENNN